ncbi:MAG: PaaI family thioesterase [Gammaproteobacteria bacterium]|nr:PaaI family thioesterase [Gammaproteobacteria bacterium]MCH9744313.1 PaaI family thioesterase [Gammaproteobacteria bacterium]
MQESLQQQYAPNSICYGCGPANSQGLHIESVVKDDKVIAHWHPQEHHHAFPGVLCGGIIGSILDCHCNWAACWYLMQDQNLDHAPSTVTAEYTIKLLRPTPVDCELILEATLEEIKGNKAVVNGRLSANDKCCDTCHGIFVAVPPGHPAYHRW